MRVVVLGGGVVGVTTAYQLQRDGHEVVVIERQEEVAAEASWGNAGMIGVGHTFVWSSPKAPGVLLRSLFLKDQALRFKFTTDPQLYAWSLKFLMQCTAEKAQRNTLLKHRIAVYSQAVLDQVVSEEKIDYDRNVQGIMYLHRSHEALERGIKQMRLLENDGQVIKILNGDEVQRLEPSIAGQGKIAGAIYCPTDETGDPAKFTRSLAMKVAERGGQLMTSTSITAIEHDGRNITGVVTDQGVVKGDAYVLAMGTHSAKLARQVGISIPVYPVKGYSLTIPIEGSPQPPAVASVDEHNLVAITSFGDRIRVTATAEFAGYDRSHKPTDFAFMKKVVMELYPQGANYDAAEMWAGLRPMTPNNLPCFGRKKFNNFFLNTGHGHIGWTMSHGSARITADLISGRDPDISMNGLLWA